jgi:hypothetical protein
LGEENGVRGVVRSSRGQGCSKGTEQEELVVLGRGGNARDVLLFKG